MRSARIGFSGYSVKFSPFQPNLLGVASSQYYGIAGNGRVSIIDFENNFRPLVEFTTKDGCFDIAFSEGSDKIIAAACGDGVVRIFDLTQVAGDRPAAALTGHSAETYSVDFNFFEKNLLCSASWDRSVRIFDILSGTQTYVSSCHSGIAYEAKFSPKSPSVMGSVGGDGKILFHDFKVGRVVQTISAHDAEILCLDFNKYREHLVATGSVDSQIKVFDARKSDLPVHAFSGHQLAVRRVKFSPHSDSLLCSCSYDTSVKLWSLSSGSLVASHEHHGEFAIGIDFSNFQRDLVASTGWDRQLAVWTLGQPPTSTKHASLSQRL